ncbi:SCO family protein [Rubellicoccus peritrichatus]|uniref:SCO family protein n=1 Tax=Rubellicoccus peritrichatus TaxID=3080537 RepID=A0AAQ3L6L7_9BACT|nr:SCO family protein [Puniceicoccus sp. CR14]WOO40280.1 SCO family protein [Puniceicoccus sp. CR14]
MQTYTRISISLLFFIGIPFLSAKEIVTTVKSADPTARTLTLEDDTVVSVSLGDAQIGYIGRQIKGDLVEEGDSKRLDFIWPDDPVDVQVANDINKQLHRDTVVRGRKAFRAVGENIPNFALYNQDGDLVTANSLKGKNLVMNFIFTRCAVATMCPASIARMSRLQREIKESDLKDVELVTFSFDPEYDTPGVMRLYGEQRGLDFANYTLLTGDPTAIKNIIKQLGVLVIPEDDTLNHTMATLIIDKNSKIIYRKDGSRWSTKDFLERLKVLESRKES